MATLKNLSFIAVVMILIFTVGRHTFATKSSPEPKFDYKYVPLSGECEKFGSLGSECWKIERVLTTPHSKQR